MSVPLQGGGISGYEFSITVGDADPQPLFIPWGGAGSLSCLSTAQVTGLPPPHVTIVRDAHAIERMAKRALLRGYGKPWPDREGNPRRRIYCDLRMGCEQPVSLEYYGQREKDRPGRSIGHVSILFEVRCRKCEWCKMKRQQFWAARARNEYDSAERTFFGTLTTAPDQRVLLDAQSRVRLKKEGVDFDTLPDKSKFGARCVTIGRHITLWLKSQRAAGADIRYLMVAEPHNPDGASRLQPHIHVLMHEKTAGSFYDGELGNVKTNGVWRRAIPDDAFCRQSWSLGFSQFILADDNRCAYYVCKYLTKETLVRLRASQKYGSLLVIQKAQREAA